MTTPRRRMPRPPARRAPIDPSDPSAPPRPAPTGPRAPPPVRTGSGRSTAPSRSTPTRRGSRKTTASTSASVSSPSTPRTASTRSTGTDLHGRFRWWGLYTQRKPGHRRRQDRHARAARARGQVLHAARPHRRRCAHHRAAARHRPASPTDFARDTADLTDRQNIQLHWIRVEDVPEIWRRLEAVGLRHHRGLRRRAPRHPRLARSPASPPTRSSTRRPLIDEITERFIGDPELANLPRKFKTAITGHPSQDVVHEINDVALVGGRTPSSASATTSGSAAALSTAPRWPSASASSSRPEQAADVWHGVTRSSATTATGACATRRA